MPDAPLTVERFTNLVDAELRRCSRIIDPEQRSEALRLIAALREKVSAMMELDGVTFRKTAAKYQRKK